MDHRQLTITPLRKEDCTALPEAFAAQGWQKPQSQYEQYLAEQSQGVRDVLVARLNGEAAGYLTLRPQALEGPFAGRGWPEITDFNVLIKFQRRGIGTYLLDCAEEKAARSNAVVCLGVGLHSGYGPAQRLYVKRGYVPDGSGVWYRDKLLTPYTPCENDDDLVLYLSKRLSVCEIRPVGRGELCPGLFHDFCRFQPVERAWRRTGGHWQLEDVLYTDRWGDGEPQAMAACLQNLLEEGGQVWGAFIDGRLKGFCAVAGRLLGARGQYADLKEMFVSADCRGRGLGRRLFSQAIEAGRALGAEKLYISAHSAEDSVAFYRAMGCVEAREPDAAHMAKEPYDMQMEYGLEGGA